MADIAPTPMHGAAYAVAIETVGGAHAVGYCASQAHLDEILRKLDELRLWSRTQPGAVRAAYAYGIDRVEQDARARLELYENNRRVEAAMLTIPRPKPDAPTGA